MPCLVISEPTAAALTERLNELEADGWKQKGGVSVAMIARPTLDNRDRIDAIYAQALTRKTASPRKDSL